MKQTHRNVQRPREAKKKHFFLLGDQFSYSDLNLSATLELLKKKVSSS